MEASQDSLWVEDDVPLRDEVVRRCRAESVTGQTRSIRANATPAGYTSFLLVYDSVGKRIRQEALSPNDRLIHTWLYRDGVLDQEIIYRESGDLDYRFDYLYESGLWKEKRMYDAQGAMSYKVVGERSTNGRLSTAVFYGPSGEVLRSDSYSYNSLGLLVQVDMGPLGGRTFEYDEKNNLIQRSTDLPSASIYGDVDEFDYDDRGLLSSKTHQHGSVTSFDWTFFA